MFRYQSVGSGSNQLNKYYLARLVRDRLEPSKISPIFLWKKIHFKFQYFSLNKIRTVVSMTVGATGRQDAYLISLISTFAL